MALPKNYHSKLLAEFKKGSCYIYCGKCAKVTLHRPDRKGSMIATIDGKTVVKKIKYFCKVCGHIVILKEKKIRK